MLTTVALGLSQSHLLQSAPRAHALAPGEDARRVQEVSEATPFAARHQDWPTFEAWARDYRQLPEALRQGHQLAVLINLEGLHALDEGRFIDAEAAMREVLKLAEGMTFLSNDNVSALPKRLREEGRCLDLCEAFAELVEKRDWRRLGK